MIYIKKCQHMKKVVYNRLNKSTIMGLELEKEEQKSADAILWTKEHPEEARTQLKEKILKAHPGNIHTLDDQRLSYLLEWLGDEYYENRLLVLLNLWGSKYFYPCKKYSDTNTHLISNDQELLIRLSGTVPGVIVISLRRKLCIGVYHCR